MKVVLFGYGKMGKNIYNSLRKNEKISDIYVVDPAFSNEKIVENQYHDFNEIGNVAFDAAFVASNSVTHADVLELVIRQGIRNIFCEKPMCLRQEEYDRIAKIMPKETRLVVDYILRSSQALGVFQERFSKLLEQGYTLTSCNVDYGKDKTKDPRRFKDVGVYEELYHVWDLVFNGPLFGKLKEIQTDKNVYTPDSTIQGRCIQQRFKYSLTPENGQTFLLNLNSSFQKESQQRSFVCFLSKGKDRKAISLVFDKNGQDQCIQVNSETDVLRDEFPANVKLDNIINDAMLYFQTGKRSAYFHDGQDSADFHRLLTKLKQVRPLQRELILDRIHSAKMV